MTDAPLSPAKVHYGGQAVIEGVMIRGPEHVAVAVRHPEGHIVSHAERLPRRYAGRFGRLPFIRGCVVLAETMTLGMRALRFSAMVHDGAGKGEQAVAFPQRVSRVSVLISALFVTGALFLAPMLLAGLLGLINMQRGIVVAVEGAVRILVLIGYMGAVSRIPDIRRVFQYHGAEHMTIHAYEHGQALDVATVRRFPKEHTRCGTSFLLVVTVIAMLVFMLFDLLVDEGSAVRMVSRIALALPVVAISYEFLRLGARFEGNPVMKALFLPNLALQSLTTKVPDDEQIEVALAAFVAAVAAADRTSSALSIAAESP